MDWYLVVLRVVHILAGVFWVGAALLTFLFLQPAARELGPAASPLMMNLAQKRRMPDVILGAAAVTVLAGVLLYWDVSNGLDGEWIGSSYGIAITVGALCGIAAVILGASIVRPSMLAMAEIGREVAASGGPPSDEQAIRIQVLQARARSIGAVIVVLLIVAVAAMAGAQYL